MFCFFFSSHLLASPFFSLSLLVVTQILGHTAGSSPPSPVRSAPSWLDDNEKASWISPFLPSSTPVELRLPTPGALSSVFFFIFFVAFGQIYSKSDHGGVRTPGPPPAAFEG